jgi:hypothetical protein
VVTISASILLPLLLLQTASSQSDRMASADTVIIMGRVVDDRGMPVANAMVSAYPPMAELHNGARTGADGTFVFHVKPFGKGVITAVKPEDGYPDPASTIYGRAGENEQKINATLAASPIDVKLRFGEPDAIIEWKVLSKADGSPVPLVRFNGAWNDDPHVFVRSGTSETGVLRFVLPKHAVQISVGAPGFRDWNSAESREFGGPVLLSPGTKDERTILLEPVK